MTDQNPVEMPAVGSHQFRVLSPTLLELTLITSKAPDPAGVAEWNFVGANFTPQLPTAQSFLVVCNGQPMQINRVGFKRRPLYAPLKTRDLRLANCLYLELAAPIADGQTVQVTNPDLTLWAADRVFKGTFDSLQYSPAIHVNQVGYHPDYSKKAMVGYYLGSLGEMVIPSSSFSLVDNAGKVVFNGTLARRLDQGYTYTPAPYQQVWEADFTAFQTAGQYRLQIPGLGVSFPFRIHAGTPAAFARSFALGLYHQRCGTSNSFPFTRDLHDACHTAMADVPDMTFTKTQEFLANMSSDYASNPRHTAPQLKDVNSSLYPFIRTGKIDVSGGHHDAGDYSKYTINSSGLVHFLTFAADSFPGAGDLDNLGIPESGDGKSDLLQEAKWEADYLVKMQDLDGGFYFLTYPKDREYEDDVLPDHGDPQVVFPKTTAVTAAAVGALAELASSPRFKQQFPAEAALYLQRAQLGWHFIATALKYQGWDGSYQKITHYGNEFMHYDEMAWAAAALFVATGDPNYEYAFTRQLLIDPNDVNTRRWTWWRMFEGYGCAIRAYAFAARSGRLQASQLNPTYLAKCEAEIIAAADDQVHFARESAYGQSFPDLNKAYRSAGWYFSSERAFDVTVGWQLVQKPEYRETVIGNYNYEAGCNPLNMSYITGIGKRRQRDIVHQYAQNDRRVLPPSGLPLGNVQSGSPWLYLYGSEMGGLSFPPDGASTAPYPYYDRWVDTFNTTTEFVVMDQARSLASLSYWMAQTPMKTQSWRAASGAQITGLPAQIPAEQLVTAALTVPGVDLSEAQIIWEARDQQPHDAAAFDFAALYSGTQWVEAEALLPDGRRVFASTNFLATTSTNVAPNSYQSAPQTVTTSTVGLYHLDADQTDAAGHLPNLALAGAAALDSSNLGWLQNRTGAALKFLDLGDNAKVTFSGSALVGSSLGSITFEAMIYVNAFKAYNRASAKLFSLNQNWNAYMELTENLYEGIFVNGGTQLSLRQTALTALTTRQWHHLRLRLDTTGYTVAVDGVPIATVASAELANWNPSVPVAIELGNFDGWMDEVVLTREGSGGTTTTGGSGSTGTGTTVTSTTTTIVTNTASGSAASYLKADTVMQGTWKGAVGNEGYSVMGDLTGLPASIQASLSGNDFYTWNESTSDPRALQKVQLTDRLASCAYSPNGFTLDLNLTDGKTHQVRLYLLDWDRSGRVEQINVADAASGGLLDQRIVSGFGEGLHLVWNIKGHVQFKFSHSAGYNAVLEGFFIDPAP